MKKFSTEMALTDLEAVKSLVQEFAPYLKGVKSQSAAQDFPWYPYDTFANVWHLDKVLKGANRKLYEEIRGKHVADIGGADGDMAFFCEYLGCTVDLIDNPPTNGNHLAGAKIVKEAIGSKVNIVSLDLDEYFHLPQKYDFAFFMGILYHLQNPFYVMSNLAKSVKRIVLSTKLASHPPASYGGHHDAGYDDVPMAYLLDSREANGDPTNYWVFTDAGMRRLIDRTGWSILDYQSFSNQERTDPVSVEGDRRVFCYLESKIFQP